MTTPPDARSRVIVALDVPTLDAALRLVEQLAPQVGAFKVGLELLTAEGGPRVVAAIHALGGRVFYDGKFDDIPNTVAGAVRGVAALGVWLYTLHASCGRAALQAALAESGQSIALAVTVLTSLSDADARQIFGASAPDAVLRFARLAADAGIAAVVCSPLELALLRADPATRHLAAVVPGVRPTWAAADDQARVLTPGEAIQAGASALVIGRPITRPPAGLTPAEAAGRVVAEVAQALQQGTAAPPLPATKHTQAC